jgi:hypothetical protein
MSINTAVRLMAQYDGNAIIPLEDMRQDYFSHLTVEKMTRRVSSGEITLPVVRTEQSKSAKGIHLQDLVDYLDKQRAIALKEQASLQSIEVCVSCYKGARRANSSACRSKALRNSAE